MYVYANYGISYYENDVHIFVKMDTLNEQTQNKNITYALEELIKSGNLFAYELGVEYLEKYSPKFIRPYTERYANGNFLKAETMWLDAMEYRQDYIVELAKARNIN